LNLDEYAKAELLFQQSLSIIENACGLDAPDTATALTALANLYAGIGNYPQAEPFYLRALKIREKALGRENPITAVTLDALGAVYLRTGDYAQAEPLFQRSLSIREKVYGPENQNTAATLNSLGNLYDQIGDYAKAEPLYQRALNISENVLGADHPDTEKNLENLGLLFIDLGEATQATAMAEQAERARLSGLANVFSFTSERERLEYETKSTPYSLFASLSDAPQLTLAILRHKGVVLDSILEDRRIAEAGQNPEDRALIDQIEPAKQRLTQLFLEVPKDLSSQGLEKRSEEREKLSGEVERLEGTLARRGVRVGQTRSALAVTVEQVQAAIPGQGVLVELLRYNHYLGKTHWEVRYGAAILAPSGEPKWVGLGPAAAIEDDIGRYQQLVRGKTNEKMLSAALRGLYQKIWRPLEPFLPAGTKTIIISPDASLNFVSFASLLTPDEKFLAEKYSLRYVASGRDLLREPVKSSSQDMVVFAAPDYVAGGRIDSPETGAYLVPLPYFAKNAADLEAEVKPWHWPIRIYSGAEASETRVRAIHSPHILHFSTHGFFLPETMRGPERYSFLGWLTDSKGLSQQVVLKNPMDRSGVALAGAQVTLDAWKRGETPPTDSDGILTAEEVGDLDLHGTWLVVLVACDTGMGEPRAGEGVMGLRRGFVQAGAQNLLMTLWPVFDVPSGKLMLDFYKVLHQNNNPSEALANVQRDWLVKLRQEYGLLPAVVMAGAFIVNTQGPIQ
jgi:CHAT domain-containing protein